MLINLSETNNIVSEWLKDIRDISTQNDRMRFRKNIERIGEIIAYEISKELNYKKIKIQTPISETECIILEKQPVLCTILRAGVPLFDGILNIFDKADCAFIASYRQHTEDGNLGINQQYATKPSIEGRPLIVADTMLATGSSFIEAIKELTKNETPSSLHIVSVISSPQGIENLSKKFPESYIWVAAIDEGLNDKGYITPGLGDAGDLCYGKKL